HGHAPRRTDVAPGLEVSLRNILQDLFVQRQLRDQPFQLAVFFLQFLQSLGLVHLQAAVFLPPAVKRLDGDRGFFAGLWGGFSVRDADFNLPQHRHDLLWFVPLHGHDPLFLQVDSLSFHLVQTWPVRSIKHDNVEVSTSLAQLSNQLLSQRVIGQFDNFNCTSRVVFRELFNRIALGAGVRCNPYLLLSLRYSLWERKEERKCKKPEQFVGKLRQISHFPLPIEWPTVSRHVIGPQFVFRPHPARQYTCCRLAGESIANASGQETGKRFP